MSGVDELLDEAVAQRRIKREAAQKIKDLDSVDLPRLRWWNYSVCDQHAAEGHTEPLVDCTYRACGGELFTHQSKAVAYLYLNESALLASSPGTGKTNVVLGLLCLLKQTKEFKRAVVICQTPAVLQWLSEAQRFTRLNVRAVPSGMTKAKRKEIYSSPHWDLLVVGYHVLMKDADLVIATEPNVVVADDVDPLLDVRNSTHKAINAIAARADRVIIANYSSIQTRIQQLYAAMVPLGGRAIWGSSEQFETRYTRSDVEIIRVPGRPLKDGRKTVRKIKRRRFTGFQNMEELRTKLAPWFWRDTYENLTDVRIPEVMTHEVWLELHPAQRRAYEELREGVLRMVTKTGAERVSRVQAATAWGHGQQICAGMAALRDGVDGEGQSVKMDWLVDKLTNEWLDRKVVVFAKNIGLIEALHARLDAAGVGYATVWGKESNAEARAAEVTRFWEDPNCRVFVGTTAIERSLNLQCANIVVALDLMLNPERVKQLVGRVRRAGSTFDKVFVFTLMCRDTQEEGYIEVLRRREALSSYVWDDENTLFEALTPAEILALIRP